MGNGRDGRSDPAGSGGRVTVRKRNGATPALVTSPRRVQCLSATAAIAVPLALIGLGALGSNPDWYVPALALATVVLFVGTSTVLVLRPVTWLGLPAVALLMGLALAPVDVIRTEALLLRGVHTRVLVTDVHSSKDKSGHVRWTCDVHRMDGLPLPHGVLDRNTGCYGRSDYHETKDVLVDPAGWVPPQTPDVDRAELNGTIAVIGAAAALYAGLVVLAGRLNLRAGRRSAGEQVRSFRRR